MAVLLCLIFLAYNFLIPTNALNTNNVNLVPEGRGLLDLPLPPCEQIARSMCDTDRVKLKCPQLCNGNANINANSNTNMNNGNTNTNANANANVNANPPPPTTSSSPSTTTASTTTRTTPTTRTTTTSSSQNNNQQNQPQPQFQPSVQNNVEPSKKHKDRAKKTSAGVEEDNSTTEKHHKKHHTKKHEATDAPNSGNNNPNPPSNPNSNRKNNANCNKVDPCVDKQTADAGFRQRCQSANIASTCLDKCRYDITFAELKKAILSKDCPMDQMRDYLKAGANNQDNRGCCKAKGVTEGKREFCHPFCNPNGNEWPGPKEGGKYLPCASQMNAIMNCHWAGLTP